MKELTPEGWESMNLGEKRFSVARKFFQACSFAQAFEGPKLVEACILYWIALSPERVRESLFARIRNYDHKKKGYTLRLQLKSGLRRIEV